ncbi:MAG: AAA family ATPase, partial [Bacteroidales bacterium]|nr:AAA family ATPase [Bacteroidales bacterium]
TLAKIIEEHGRTIRFSPDEWIKKIIWNENDEKQLQVMRGPIEDIQLQLTYKLLKAGLDVILENGFWTTDERMKYLNTLKPTGARINLYYLNIPYDVLIKRINERNSRLTDSDLFIDEKELSEWSKIFEAPSIKEIKLYDDYREYSH